MDRWIRYAPGLLILAALIFAPWAYGATRPWAITALNWMLGACVASWALNCLLFQCRPALPRVMIIATLLLAAQAWFMVLNAKYDYHPASQEFIPLDPPLDWAPGSLHRALSIESATQLSLLLGALFVMADLVRHPDWRRRLLWTMALTGSSLAVLGLAQKLTDAPGIFWRAENLGENFFATWRNHTNAGAFLNLTWPLAAGLAVGALHRGSAFWKKALWLSVAVVILAALLVNTSRAAAALAVGLVLAWGLWITWQLLRGRFEGVNPVSALSVGVVLVALAASLAALAGLDSSIRRWKQFDRQLTEHNSRLLAAKVCLKMIPDAGWFGFGPGTFQTTFPYYTHEFGKQLEGRWVFAHQDYLQTMAEWGLAGTAAWAVLIAGGVASALAGTIRRKGRLSLAAHARQFALISALAGVLLHALVDFPLQIVSIQLYAMALLATLWSSVHWLGSSERRTIREHPTALVQEAAPAV